jgi:hypothetical protein
MVSRHQENQRPPLRLLTAHKARVGKSVKTENKYVGPAACAPSIAPSTYSITAAIIPEEAIYNLVPSTAQLNGNDRRD